MTAADGYVPTVSFAGERVRVGRFVARPSDPWFADSGPARGHLVVFPRLPVRITHVGERPVLADATRIMFYNRGQEYRRDALSAEGDRCLWLAFDAADVADAGGRCSTNDAIRPFSRSSGPGDSATFLLQELVWRHVAGGAPTCPLAIEELGMHLLRRAMDNATRDAPRGDSEGHQRLAERLREVVHATLGGEASLAEIARAAGTSPFHATRVFKRHTGLTLHDYRDALRLCGALERLATGERDLTAVALDAGYASHSHFTFAFRRRFGLPPSQARRLAMPDHLAELRALPTRTRARS